MALTNKVKPKNSEKRGKKQLKELKFVIIVKNKAISTIISGQSIQRNRQTR
jgi:hypothetical protein